MTSANRTYGVDLRALPAADAHVPLTDLTLRRAYGAFDFLRVERGVPTFADDHLARLERSADLLDLAPRPDPDAIRAHVRDVIDANVAAGAVDDVFGLQLYLTGGDPDDGFTPGTPRLLVLVVDLPPAPASAYDEGVALLTHRFERDLPEAKTTNYFTAVRHARTLRERGAADLLYHDGERVLEATRCNVFVSLDGETLLTPGAGVLPGVTRTHVLAALEGDVPAAHGEVPLDALADAHEVFLASTTKGVMPVTRIDDRPVGRGVPGDLTRRAMARFGAHRDAWVAAHADAWRPAATS
ncbi:MAG: aminotransferase class IV [Trueperaceae bacterium]|nr:aminotransferase class IV [Trueperaceae bacterium]